MNARQKELYTAQELARFCAVDIKTIHNWVDRGEIAFFRTPGRHLRFRRAHVIGFLQRYGYPIPEDLVISRPRIVVIDADATALLNVKKNLAKVFEVATYEHAVDALLAIGASAPDAVIVEPASLAISAETCIARARHWPTTESIRWALYSGDRNARKQAADLGGIPFVPKPHVNKLREVLEASLAPRRP